METRTLAAPAKSYLEKLITTVVTTTQADLKSDMGNPHENNWGMPMKSDIRFVSIRAT
jgi:hypothetical protein